MKDSLRVALIQPKPYPSFDDPRNIGHALLLLEKCNGQQLDIICFPEYFPFQGENELRAQAARLDSYLVAGLVEDDGEHRFNTATLFDRSGRVVGRQRKRHVAALERERLGISPGDDTFRAFKTDFATIGICVCVDFWGQPAAARQLAEQGVEVVFNMGIFPIFQKHWHTGVLTRCFDHFMAAVGVNTADYNAVIDGKRVHMHGGRSFVIEPPKLLDKEDFRRWMRAAEDLGDWVRVELNGLEQVHIAEVNLSTVRRFRKAFRRRLGFD